MTFAPPKVKGDPFAIVAGPKGTVWFSEDTGNSIDRLSLTTEHISRFQIPTPSADVAAITLGPDGRMWFTENGAQRIGAVNADGSISEYQLSPGAGPWGITSGPDQNLWFTDENLNAIGTVTRSGSVTEFAVPSGNTPISIAAGPDGNLWFTEASSLIGRASTNGEIVEFQTSASETVGILAANDGNLWYCEPLNHKLGRITTSGEVSDFYISGSAPQALASGGPGFEEFVIVGAGLAEYNIRSHRYTFIGNAPGSPGVGPIALGPDGNIWFTQPQQGTMSVFVRHILNVAPPSLTLNVGQKATLTASETGASRPLHAETSNPAIATVSATGSNTFNVTGVGSGSCTVTVADDRHNEFPVSITVQ